MNNEADEQLVRRCAGGDAGALEVLYRRHVEGVWRYAWLRTHDRESAADIVQDTFLRVLRSASGFAGKSTVSTWLFAVTRSATLDHLRRRQREQARCVAGTVLRLVPAPAEASPPIEQAEVRTAVHQAVSRLPANERDAIILHELLGRSVRECGIILGWGDSRVKVTLFRARRRLRDLLRGWVVGEERRAGAGS